MHRQSGGYGRPREARLRPEAAALYPGVVPDTWCQAAIMADRVWALRLGRGEGAAHFRDRVLDPEHFEFRNAGGGVPGPLDRRATGTHGPEGGGAESP